MESPSIGNKRKKRKTRKCLDELRKRSRSTNYNKSSNKNEESRRKVDNAVGASHPTNNFITNCRLTLRPVLLSKTIQSETITRQAISVNNRIPPPTSPILSLKEQAADKKEKIPLSSISCEPETKTNDTVVEISVNGIDNQERSNPSDNLIFSPVSEPSDAGSSINAESSALANGNNLFTDLMESLPKYLQENAPMLFKKDIISRTKQQLLSLIQESRLKNRMKEISKPRNGHIIDTQNTIDNPMEYIKRHNSKFNLSSDGSISLCSTPSPGHPCAGSPYAVPGSVQSQDSLNMEQSHVEINLSSDQSRASVNSPAYRPSRISAQYSSVTIAESPADPAVISTSAASGSQISCVSSPDVAELAQPIQAFINNTPNYFYYPRRLN